MAKHLHPRIAGFQKRDHTRHMICIATRHRQEQRADGLLLDVVDTAMDESERTGHGSGEV
jgi:hypothetical protein